MNFMIPASLGSALGTAQTFVLREYVDNAMANNFLSGQTSNYPFVKQLGGFGTPSALGGIITGIIGLGLGYYGATKGKILRSFNSQIAAMTYGASSLVGGILSGIYPTVPVMNAIKKDPNNPIYTQSSSMRRGSMVIRPSHATVVKPTSNQEILRKFQTA